mgnify:CR=1 FL=1
MDISKCLHFLLWQQMYNLICSFIVIEERDLLLTFVNFIDKIKSDKTLLIR